jgi:hypothetical protein
MTKRVVRGWCIITCVHGCGVIAGGESVVSHARATLLVRDGLAFTVTRAARLPHCESDEAAGLAPGGTTARVLAPSKEALDTPLNPPPLDDEPGPATRRSGTYRDGTPTRWLRPASRTQHDTQCVRHMTTEVAKVLLEGRGPNADDLPVRSLKGSAHCGNAVDQDTIEIEYHGP